MILDYGFIMKAYLSFKCLLASQFAFLKDYSAVFSQIVPFQAERVEALAKALRCDEHKKSVRHEK